MNNANILLDKFAKVCGHESDKAIADALRVRQSAVSNWRHARAHPSAEAIERMCSAIHEPLRHWLPLIEADRARTPADKRVWLRLAQAAAAFAMIYLFSRLDVQMTDGVSLAFVYIMRNCLIAFILACAACAALKRQGKQSNARFLE